MLPLPLYFSEEFRLMSANQLLQGVFQSALIEEARLSTELKSLGLTLTGSTSTAANSTAPLPIFPMPATSARVHTWDQANHQFNLYLHQIEELASRPTESIKQLQINPLNLYPNCSLNPDHRTRSSLIKKLAALLQLARAENICLLLQQPTEQQLECWLSLLNDLMRDPALRGTSQESSQETSQETPQGISNFGVGIGLSAASKRLLPTLGYLESLGNELKSKIAIQILEQPFNNDQRSYARFETPILTMASAIRLNLAAACAFLESTNSQHLQPELVISDPRLQPVMGLICSSKSWPCRLCDPPPAPKPKSDLGFSDRPCSLRGIHIIEQRLKLTRESLELQQPKAAPVIAGEALTSQAAKVRFLPSDIHTPVGSQVDITELDAKQAFKVCSEGEGINSTLSAYARRTLLEAFAERVLRQQFELACLCARETGKPVNDCLYEIEDSIVLLDQHLQLASSLLSPQEIHASCDTVCELTPLPLGTLLGFTPWSQPILQFIAMTSAALLSGNTLLIKPAAQAALTAHWLFDQLLACGVPAEYFALLPGSLDEVGSYLLEDYRLDGVLFCGSALAAAEIQHRLTKRAGAPLIPVISDTGGRHAAIIDADQSINDLLPRLLRGAFSHAGQHHGSLRVLYVETTLADELLDLLSQAINQLRIGSPESRETDIGPLVSRKQMDNAYMHIERFQAAGRLLAQGELNSAHQEGYFVPPTLLKLYTLDELQEQIEAPILHLVRFDREELNAKLDEINRSGIGMALSLFSGDSALTEQVKRYSRASELNINPPTLCPNSMECPGAGLGLSGTAARPGTADYLRALVRYQRLSEPGDGINLS
ncbi:aldehyde dehydrogenase family protein [Marinobacterium lutimaris]|uniref:Aldehyde dehydrogenase family protein n=1 Tax=Marinobacterium lutimaris TaxID=568106 RepID=A0A1H5UA57_9GAMM|nr:aldehyde dehydrogenase family protein [Marinobacterium lutimaris]SEF71904.1 Aldehyde dehydrogenase family protein [Marinobacterium lutimaris]